MAIGRHHGWRRLEPEKASRFAHDCLPYYRKAENYAGVAQAGGIFVSDWPILRKYFTNPPVRFDQAMFIGPGDHSNLEAIIGESNHPGPELWLLGRAMYEEGAGGHCIRIGEFEVLRSAAGAASEAGSAA